MLKALWRWFWPQEPEKTQPAPILAHPDAVSRAEFEAAIQKLEQRIEWDLSEWYDKFSTLHARTAKRAQREQNGNGGKRVEHEPPREAPPSILQYRRPWSP